MGGRCMRGCWRSRRVFFTPGIRSEFALARALDFALFTVAVYTFSRYWRALAEWSKSVSRGDTSIPATSSFLWIVLGYMLFVANFVWSVDVVNPDILVAFAGLCSCRSPVQVARRCAPQRQHLRMAGPFAGDRLLREGHFLVFCAVHPGSDRDSRFSYAA